MNRTPFLARLLCALLAAGAMSSALAGPPGGGPAGGPAGGQDGMPGQRPPKVQGPPPPQWEQLSPAQREMVIAVLRDRWNDNPRDRARMLKHAERWKTMTPEQRRKAHRGMHRWASMKPEERQRMRALYDESKGMSPQEREALRQKLQAMTPEQRREWLRVKREQRRQRNADATP